MRIFKKLLILASIMIGISVSCYSSESFSSLHKLRLPRVIAKDTARVNSLTRQGFTYLTSKMSFGEVKACIDSALSICDRNNIEVPSLLRLLMAEYYFYTGDFSRASEEANEALIQSSYLKEHQVNAKVLGFLGSYYARTGFYKESLEYFDKCIELSLKHRLKGIIPKVYGGRAGVLNTVRDTSGYQQQLRMMIDAAYEEKDTASAIRGNYLLGTSLCGPRSTCKYRDFRKADSILRISYSLSLIKKDSGIISSSLANTGWNFYLEKMYDSALYYYNKSLVYNLASKNYGASANALGNIGTIYRDLGRHDVSVKYYMKGLEHARKINDYYDLRWIYEDMSMMYLGMKDTSRAFDTYVLFKRFNDSLMIQERSKGLSDAVLRYETETRNKEVELLSLRLKNNRLLNYGFAVFTFMIITIGILLFSGSKLKEKRRISEMNRKISEITQANLRQQMNPHFIFNTLNSIQYYMYQHDKLATNNYLTKFSNLMRKILDNSQHTSVTLSDELSALRLYLELENLRFKDKFDYEINIGPNIDPLLYKIPTMLIQPYVENSICHGLIPLERKGKVKIDLKLEKDYLLCVIEDNGIGRDAARERKLKRGDNHNSLGTQITASRLDLVNALYGTSLKTIYTDLKNNSGESEGTRVEIHIPIMT